MALAGIAVYGSRYLCATACTLAAIPLAWAVGDRLGGIVGPYLLRRLT